MDNAIKREALEPLQLQLTVQTFKIIQPLDALSKLLISYHEKTLQQAQAFNEALRKVGYFYTQAHQFISMVENILPELQRLSTRISQIDWSALMASRTPTDISQDEVLHLFYLKGEAAIDRQQNNEYYQWPKSLDLYQNEIVLEIFALKWQAIKEWDWVLSQINDCNHIQDANLLLANFKNFHDHLVWDTAIKKLFEKTARYKKILAISNEVLSDNLDKLAGVPKRFYHHKEEILVAGVSREHTRTTNPVRQLVQHCGSSFKHYLSMIHAELNKILEEPSLIIEWYESDFKTQGSPKSLFEILAFKKNIRSLFVETSFSYTLDHKLDAFLQSIHDEISYAAFCCYKLFYFLVVYQVTLHLKETLPLSERQFFTPIQGLEKLKQQIDFLQAQINELKTHKIASIIETHINAIKAITRFSFVLQVDDRTIQILNTLHAVRLDVRKSFNSFYQEFEDFFKNYTEGKNSLFLARRLLNKLLVVSNVSSISDLQAQLLSQKNAFIIRDAKTLENYVITEQLLSPEYIQAIAQHNQNRVSQLLRRTPKNAIEKMFFSLEQGVLMEVLRLEFASEHLWNRYVDYLRNHVYEFPEFDLGELWLKLTRHLSEYKKLLTIHSTLYLSSMKRLLDLSILAFEEYKGFTSYGRLFNSASPYHRTLKSLAAFKETFNRVFASAPAPYFDRDVFWERLQYVYDKQIFSVEHFVNKKQGGSDALPRTLTPQEKPLEIWFYLLKALASVLNKCSDFILEENDFRLRNPNNINQALAPYRLPEHIKVELFNINLFLDNTIKELTFNQQSEAQSASEKLKLALQDTIAAYEAFVITQQPEANQPLRKNPVMPDPLERPSPP